MTGLYEGPKELIAQAKREGKWLFCHYQQLWFSPEDLEEANAQGRFNWGAVNWRLRDPQEHVDELRRSAWVEAQRLADAEREVARWREGR